MSELYAICGNIYPVAKRIGAQHLIEIKQDLPLDTVCFHVQQCAEKYIKAYLIYCEIDFKKSHDLGELILREPYKIIKTLSWT